MATYGGVGIPDADAAIKGRATDAPITQLHDMHHLVDVSVEDSHSLARVHVEDADGLVPGPRADECGVVQDLAVLHRLCVASENLLTVACGEVPHSRGVVRRA